uniref:Uncharacterized protein n=1 Tax=Romanomermis culicivorax TaxID=13658 RepID=A0A915L718_ROMCU
MQKTLLFGYKSIQKILYSDLIYDTLEEEEQRFVNFAVHYCAMSLFQVQLQFHPNLLPFKPALTQYAVMTQEETRRTLFKNMGDEEISRKWQPRPPNCVLSTFSKLCIVDVQATVDHPLFVVTVRAPRPIIPSPPYRPLARNVGCNQVFGFSGLISMIIQKLEEAAM